MSPVDLPPRLERMSRVPHRLLTWGVPMGPLVLLRSRGRRTGQVRTTPVALLRDGGHRWLVSPFGDTAWVHNVRHHPHAEVGRGRRYRPVRLVEMDDERKPEILRRYRRAFRVVPFVRYAFRDETGDDVDPFRHPVFLIAEM